MSDGNEVYYRVVLREDRYEVCTLQWFDEYGYDRTKWATSLKFPSKEAAELWAAMRVRANVFATNSQLITMTLAIQEEENRLSGEPGPVTEPARGVDFLTQMWYGISLTDREIEDEMPRLVELGIVRPIPLDGETAWVYSGPPYQTS